ncbi:hypothetical protein ACHQM5_020482 [Ranunculus cassubicifolius]
MERLPTSDEITTNILCFFKDPLQLSIYNTDKSNKPFKIFDFVFLSQKFCLYADPRILGSCHGFICLTQGTNTPIPHGSVRTFADVFFPFLNPISVFNPITHEYSLLPNFTIPECTSCAQQTGKFFYKCYPGFGFEFWKKEFKMVLLVFTARNYTEQIFDSQVQICTLGSNIWKKKLGLVPHVLSQASNASVGVFLCGCLHWFVSDQSVKNDNSVIVSFNLGLEEFGFIVPPELHKVPYGFCRRFGVLEECLSVVECCHNFLVNVWVMQMYNVQESWVKRFTIMLQDPFYDSNLSFKAVDIVQVRQNGELVFLCDDNYMASYNIPNKKWRVIEVRGSKGRGKGFVGSIQVHPFVGFSISLKSARAAFSIERLPPELTTNILSRLSFKATAQCKCVSKPWLAIISDPAFLSVQLTNSSKIDTDILALSKEPQPRGLSMYYLEETAINKTPSKLFTHFDWIFLQRMCIYADPRILGSCYGLVCVTQGTNTPIPAGGFRVFQDVHFPFLNPIHTFNPVTGEYSHFPNFTVPACDYCRPEDGKLFYKCFPGFGFEDSKKEFKMVLVMFSVRNYKSQLFNNEVHICKLGGNAWRKKIAIAPDVLVQANNGSSGVFLHGCLHWIVVQKEKSLIVSFDLGVEEFRLVPTPSLQKSDDGYCTRFGILEERLSVVECCRDSRIHIWVMQQYNVKESWVMRFSIILGSSLSSNMSFSVAEILKIRKNGELVLLCDDKYMVSYDIASQKCRVLEVQGFEGMVKDYDGNLKAIPFAGSFISCGKRSDNRDT